MADGYDSIKNHRIIIPQQSFSIEFTFSFCYPQIPAARTPHNTQGCLLLWLWYRIHQRFDALLITFKYHEKKYYRHFTMKGKVRQRISYNRKNSVLPLIQDKTLFIIGIRENQSSSETPCHPVWDAPAPSQQMDSSSFWDIPAYIENAILMP